MQLTLSPQPRPPSKPSHLRTLFSKLTRRAPAPHIHYAATVADTAFIDEAVCRYRKALAMPEVRAAFVDIIRERGLPTREEMRVVDAYLLGCAPEIVVRPLEDVEAGGGSGISVDRTLAKYVAPFHDEHPDDHYDRRTRTVFLIFVSLLRERANWLVRAHWGCANAKMTGKEAGLMVERRLFGGNIEIAGGSCEKQVTELVIFTERDNPKVLPNKNVQQWLRGKTLVPINVNHLGVSPSHIDLVLLAEQLYPFLTSPVVDQQARLHVLARHQFVTAAAVCLGVKEDELAAALVEVHMGVRHHAVKRQYAPAGHLHRPPYAISLRGAGTSPGECNRCGHREWDVPTKPTFGGPSKSVPEYMCPTAFVFVIFPSHDVVKSTPNLQTV
ncbi:hypothetical protein HK104_009222 [Borealophlyctis nickersoniae]|nr:hypothetical protein HK104_009222 [Borealophlyctis nickersoniae]